MIDPEIFSQLLAVNSARILSLLAKSVHGKISEDEKFLLNYLLQVNEKLVRIVEKSAFDDLQKELEDCLSMEEDPSKIQDCRMMLEALKKLKKVPR